MKYIRNSDSRVATIEGEEKGRVVVKDELSGEILRMKPEAFRSRYTPIQNTYAATAEALAPYWTAIRDNIKSKLSKGILNMYAKLEAAGWDAAVAFPYPRSNMGRMSYLIAKEEYHFARRWTKSSSKHYRGMNDPEPRVMMDAEELAAAVTKQADRDATDVVRSYIHKLAAKEDELRASGTPSAEVVKAEYTGALWSHSTMKFTLADGTVHTWKTHMILNVSCLGKLFNQFPTRLV